MAQGQLALEHKRHFKPNATADPTLDLIADSAAVQSGAADSIAAIAFSTRDLLCRRTAALITVLHVAVEPSVVEH